MAAGIDAVAPGVRQCDAVAAIYDAAVRGADGAGGDYPAIVPMLPTGPGTGHAAPDLERRSRSATGEATILELAGCHRRYHCPMARTVFLGRPPRPAASTPRRRPARASRRRSPPSGRASRCEEVEAAWRRHIASARPREVVAHRLLGRARLSARLGRAHDEPAPGRHDASWSPGMTFHMIVGMWMDGWGYELSETFHVTRTARSA